MADGARFLSTLKQPMPFRGDRITSGRPALNNSPNRSSKALISARVPSKLFKISAYRVAWSEFWVARTAGLRQRQETLIAGSGQKCLTRGKATIKRSDADACALGDFLQRNTRSFFQEKLLGGRKDTFAPFLRVSPEGRFITHLFPLSLDKWRLPPYPKWSNPPLVKTGTRK